MNISGASHITPIFLAPMAGITDAPFRAAVNAFGIGRFVTEMVPSRDILHAKPSARARATLGFDARNTSVQLAGRDPSLMADAARYCEDNGAHTIDINFGCPAKKVVSGQGGAALMRQPDLALAIVDSVVSAVSIPVTIKMRLGWDENNLNAAEIASRATESGAAMVTVHGRTRNQQYRGAADWRAVARVKEAATITPVIVNGDIHDGSSARKAARLSGADGVMIGRASRGRPWLLAQIAAEFSGEKPPPDPTGDALVEIVAAHYESILAFYGKELGVRVARKHLSWYFECAGADRRRREPVLRSTSSREVLSCLRDLLRDTPKLERSVAA